MNCDPNSLVALATAAGYMNMSVKQQMAVETYLDCQIANGGGGGGGGTPNLIGNYGGVAPVTAGTAVGQFATDSSTLMEWQWNGTVWVNLF